MCIAIASILASKIVAMIIIVTFLEKAFMDSFIILAFVFG